MADTALNTARAGYLTRRLFDVAHDVVVLEGDCGTKEGVLILRPGKENIGGSFSERIVGRVLAEGVNLSSGALKRGTLIMHDAANVVESSDVKEVMVRSPMTCKAHYAYLPLGRCRDCRR